MGTAAKVEALRKFGMPGPSSEQGRLRAGDPAARDAHELMQRMLDALPAHIAITNGQGVILAVNRAWRHFGQENGLGTPADGVGSSYLGVCEAARESVAEAGIVADAIRALGAGWGTDLRLEYRCDGGAAPRWFQLRVTRFGKGTETFLVFVHEDISDVKTAEDELRAVTARMLSVRDDERRRIARDLHDTTAQNLLALSLDLTRLRCIFDGDSSAGELIRECEALCAETIAEVRTVSYVLHPPLLDEAGLWPALRWFVQGFCRRTDVSVDLDLPKSPERLDRDVELALFRVVQEALANVHRHAADRRARVRVEISGQALMLEVADGEITRGEARFADASRSLGVGIAGMRERLVQLGGRLDVLTGPRGTRVIAHVPRA